MAVPIDPYYRRAIDNIVKDTYMARTNAPNTFTEKTHEGAPAARMTPIQALRRSVMSCFLWEQEFYEDGTAIASRIGDLVSKCNPVDVARLAIEARNVGHLRHVPLLLLCHLAVSSRGTPLMRETVPQVVKRADEITELAAIWWKLHPDTHLPHNMEKGLRACWPNFSEYQLAKYDRDNAVKLRDVMRLTHPKARAEDRNELYKHVIDRTLTTPDTWEVELSAGKDKRETWTRLILERKLGGLATLRNLRNMVQTHVDESYIRIAIATANYERVLPFRFTAAARIVPQFERELDHVLLQKIMQQTPLPGKTCVLVDVSGSMKDKLSLKSDLSRMDAAATLAAIVPAEYLRVFSFSNNLVECPPRRGMAGVDAVIKSQEHRGTELFKAVETVNRICPDYDRLIVITDEQAFPGGAHAPLVRMSIMSHGGPTNLPSPLKRGYMINVASAKNGVGYGRWTHIDGFSENVIRFIQEYERTELT